MNFTVDLPTASHALVLVVAIECIAWLALGLIARVARRGALVMALANFIFIAAGVLSALRETMPGLLALQGAAFVSILGFMTMRVAILLFMRISIPWVEIASHLAVSVLIFGLIPPARDELPKMQFVVSISVFLMMVRIAQESWPRIRDEFGVRAAVLLLLPFGFFAVLELMLRTMPLARFMFGGGDAALALTGAPFTVGVLVAVFWMNASIIGLGLGRLVRRIRQLSEYDPLTGVRNRRALEHVLRSERARLGRTRQSFALLIFDLDHFKQVNDTYGHAVGDAVLKHAAKLIGSKLREQDVLGRYGGEEFVVILPTANREGAWGAAERMRRQFEESPLAQDQQSIRVTASFGLAVVTDPGESAEDIYRRADAALYLAKANGRNRVEELPDAPAAAQR